MYIYIKVSVETASHLAFASTSRLTAEDDARGATGRAGTHTQTDRAKRRITTSSSVFLPVPRHVSSHGVDENDADDDKGCGWTQRILAVDDTVETGVGCASSVTNDDA